MPIGTVTAAVSNRMPYLIWGPTDFGSALSGFHEPDAVSDAATGYLPSAVGNFRQKTSTLGEVSALCS